MRKPLLTLTLLALILTSAPALAQEAPELQINSKRYVVIDAQSGHVYAQKNAHEQVAIASLTKVFTAVQALEMASPDTLITTDESDLFGSSATTMGFGPGETYTLTDLIYGMLLPSGNDAARAIARSLGAQPGDTPDEAVQRFMDLLNQRVADMGLTDTHLITPSGWGVPGHYSSAWDVAAMMQQALHFPLIVDAISTLSYTTSNGALTVTNTNKLLHSYDALLGGKTGYDDDAGWCLTEVAQHGERRMISVTLDGIAPDDWYDDNRRLLEYGFGQEANGGNADWTGDIVRWQDPAIAEFNRSATSDSRIVGSDVPEVVELPEVEPVVIPEFHAKSVDASNAIGAALVIGLLLAVRGSIAFRRWPLGRLRDVDAESGAL